MKNQEIAKIFRDISRLLEINGIAFKPKAYLRAAESLEKMSGRCHYSLSKRWS